MPGIVTLTTDFGAGDYVGAMKGAILTVDPELTIVDVDHEVRPHDVRHGAYILYSAVPYYPFAAHVGVVDPGVGTKRRAILCVCEGALLVGPDNGLLIPAARRLGLKEVRNITNRKLGRPDLSDTFHGRDLFGPVAAHLLSGTKVKDVGPVLRDFVDLDFGVPKKRKGGFEGVVITYDRFGNVVTNIPRSEAERTWSFGDRLAVAIRGYEMTVPLVRTYGIVPPGEFLATLSSSGFLELSRRESNAASQLEVVPGMPVTVTKA
jgi:S-adenosyl-L-methionine hydrolase (adenosine-forming)